MYLVLLPSEHLSVLWTALVSTGIFPQTFLLTVFQLGAGRPPAHIAVGASQARGTELGNSFLKGPVFSVVLSFLWPFRVI